MAVGNAFSTVWKILYAQFFALLLTPLLFWGISGWQAVLSPLLGGGIAWLPNLYFAYKIYLARYADAKSILQAFYAAESIKLVLTVALFAMVLQMAGIDFLALLIGYVTVLSVFWLALLLWRE